MIGNERCHVVAAEWQTAMYIQVSPAQVSRLTASVFLIDVVYCCVQDASAPAGNSR